MAYSPLYRGDGGRSNWKLPAWIPNQDGLLIEVKMRDGSQHKAQVCRGEGQTHSLLHLTTDHVSFSDVIGWRHA